MALPSKKYYNNDIQGMTKAFSNGDGSYSPSIGISSSDVAVPVDIQFSALQDDQSLPVKSYGSKKNITRQYLDQTFNVAPNSSFVISLTPNPYELRRLKSLRVLIPRPTGSTTGTHRLDVIMGTEDKNDANFSILSIRNSHDKPLETFANVVVGGGTDTRPSTEQLQQTAILNAIATPGYPIHLRYANQTDVAQTSNITLRVAWEVDFIV